MINDSETPEQPANFIFPLQFKNEVNAMQKCCTEIIENKQSQYAEYQMISSGEITLEFFNYLN